MKCFIFATQMIFPQIQFFEKFDMRAANWNF